MACASVTKSCAWDIFDISDWYVVGCCHSQSRRGYVRNNRGRGRGRGNGQGKKKPVDKSADELDKELDKYHAEAMQT